MKDQESSSEDVLLGSIHCLHGIAAVAIIVIAAAEGNTLIQFPK